MDEAYSVYWQEAQADNAEEPDDMEDVTKQLMSRINIGGNLTDAQRKQPERVVASHTESSAEMRRTLDTATRLNIA